MPRTLTTYELLTIIRAVTGVPVTLWRRRSGIDGVDEHWSD